MVSVIRKVCAAVLLVAIAACTEPQKVNTEAPPALTRDTQILLVPPDVELFQLTAAGLLEPRADWSEAGQRNVLEALRAENKRRHVRFVELDYAALTDAERAEVAQIEKLHEIVANSMMAHRYIPALRLPNKESVYDWSLGPDVALLRKANGGQGNYALFVTLRDSFSSTGRVVLGIIAALGGVAVSGGVQAGYVSLVDLDTGQIAWFGTVRKGVGDLRKPGSAGETVADLLEGLPG